MYGLYLTLLGGWLLTSNFMVDSSTIPPAWTTEPSYRGINNFTNKKMGITTSAMKELRGHLSFTRMRFHCSKQQGRTLRVTTATKNFGKTVVQYFSGQTNTLLDSCLSFVRMKDDNSYLFDLPREVEAYKKTRWNTFIRSHCICCWSLSLEDNRKKSPVRRHERRYLYNFVKGRLLEDFCSLSSYRVAELTGWTHT